MKARLVALFLLWAIGAGAQEAVYLVSGSQLPVAVAANGYVQSVIPAPDGHVEVHVATALGPIGSAGTYAEITSTAVAGIPANFELPERLRTSLRPHLSAWEAATLVLEWTLTNVVVDASDTGGQDAANVLHRGRGRCSGVANATAALLMAAGFEAVTVSGLLVTADDWVPHRWVACRLPGAGWVHTDPTLGLWAMTPSHMAFADAVVSQPEVHIAKQGRNEIGRLPRRGGRPLRPDLGSDLVCRLVGEASAIAVATLHGEGGEIHRTTLDPEGKFTALLPGRWRLVVTADDAMITDTVLELRPGRIHSFTVALPEGDGNLEVGS